jgi:hypothetical protein
MSVASLPPALLEQATLPYRPLGSFDLLLRVGNASAGLPFRISTWVDRVVTSVRRHRVPRLYCRTLSQWQQALANLGFTVESIPMHQGTPFANVLLVARLPDTRSTRAAP